MISVKDLHYSYGNKKVFSGLNLQASKGCIYGLLGKNGTGKTTFLYNLAGLLFPASGSIDVGGFTPSKRQPGFLQETFIVPEEFHLPDISIKNFIKYTSPFYPWFIEERFIEYLNEFGIPGNVNLQSLSFGQKKKVLISFAIAANTSLLLMDEPTNGLDIAGKSQFKKIIAGSFDEKKCIIISSHQVKDLESLIDRVVIMDEGRIILNESISRIGEKLCFKISFDANEVAWSIYNEPLLRGHAVVAVNVDDDESKIDLEMLYKATMANPNLIQSIFNS
ncbi:MAG TPA: ABC transporter ATP-binding protein [Chitinophagaceae bacterium]|nr:ABC transporter ATP-binding protein [Chitinophagaceae bacterium]